jgi:5-methylthioadenosine/S-adenosylhomocysteine deaminase
MCKLCDDGSPQSHSGSRRDFLKATAASGVAAAGANLFTARPAAAHGDHDDPLEDHGRRGRRYVIRGGSVMSMDPSVGDFPQAHHQLFETALRSFSRQRAAPGGHTRRRHQEAVVLVE